MRIQLKQSCLVALAMFLMSASAVNAAEQVTFGRKMAAGDKLTFSQVTVSDNSISVSANGQVVQQMQQKMTQNRSGTTSIEAVDESGKPTKTTFVFDKTTGGEMAMNGQPAQAVPSGLAGKTITVTRTGEKELNFSAEVDEAAAAEVKEMFTQEHTLLPTKPVTVGDSWDIDPSELKAMAQPGAQMDAKAKGKLISVETTGGRQVATVEFTISMNGAMQGMNMSSELQGKGTMDVASGQPVDIEISGPVKATGRQQTPNGVVDIAMNGKMTMNMKAKREASGAGGEVVKPVVPGGNPLAAAPDFAGTYSNEDTTVKLVSGIAGWTGTIKRGDKEFPISKATTSGSKITGKFTVGTDAFDFDATLDGKTLTLSTGGATYTLTRAASANPLGK